MSGRQWAVVEINLPEMVDNRSTPGNEAKVNQT